MDWQTLENSIFSFLDKFNKTNILDETLRILDREESRRWKKVIKDVIGLDCIPYALYWDGVMYTHTLEKSVNIAPEYGLLIPGNKSYEDIITNHFEAEEDLSKADFLRREYKDYQRWKKANNNVKIDRDQVAGLVIPLSLGGKETFKNKKLIDAEANFTMAWEISHQAN